MSNSHRNKRTHILLSSALCSYLQSHSPVVACCGSAGTVFDWRKHRLRLYEFLKYAQYVYGARRKPRSWQTFYNHRKSWVLYEGACAIDALAITGQRCKIASRDVYNGPLVKFDIGCDNDFLPLGDFGGDEAHKLLWRRRRRFRINATQALLHLGDFEDPVDRLIEP